MASRIKVVKELRRLRVNAGLSQGLVAHKAGLDRSHLSLAECGYVTLTSNELEAIRRVILRAVEQRQSQLKALLENAEPVHAEA